MILPASEDAAAEVVGRCDGVLLTGGDDPIMEAFGEVSRRRPPGVGRESRTPGPGEAHGERNGVAVVGV